MPKFIAVVTLCLSLSACGGGADTATSIPAQPGVSASEQLAEDLIGLSLDDFYAESFKALTYRSPEGIIWDALTSVYPLDSVGLDDLSDAYTRETYAMHQVVLDALRGYDRSALTPGEQLTFDLYEWFLQDTADRLEFIYYDFLATYNFNGVQNGTQRFFTDIHPLATQQDAEDYVTRLNAVRNKFQQVSDYLTQQSAAGIIEPAITMDVALYYIGQIADGAVDSNPYYTSFRDKLDDIAGLSSAARQTLLDAARAATADSVIIAHQELRTTINGLRDRAPGSIGVGQFPRGNDYYAYMLKHRTTTSLTAAEIHQLGLDELVRIHAEMRVVFDSLGYPQNETLQELYARVAADGGIIPAAQVRSVYEDIIAAAEANLDEAFDIFPSADVIVADDPYGGFYIGPSFDGTRPGAFYAGTLNDLPWYDMPSLTYHESIPGHHTQIAIAMDQGGPALRRGIRFTAFVEGWALYAERLAYELGWYENDPYGNLGRLQYEALRAARLVMDTGIHSLGWSFDQTSQFLQDNNGATQGAADSATARYSVVPAQATAYMVGMLHILQLRQQAIDELGAEFDLREFHRVVLTSGGIPLALLDGVIERYIAEKLATP